MPIRVAVLVAVSMLAAAAAARSGEPGKDEKEKVVLFVCEHGAAKSVMAAAHFNRAAREKGLPYRAIAKGTDPQEELSTAAVKGLGAEGLEARPARPERVIAADVAAAARAALTRHIGALLEELEGRGPSPRPR